MNIPAFFSFFILFIALGCTVYGIVAPELFYFDFGFNKVRFGMFKTCIGDACDFYNQYSGESLGKTFALCDINNQPPSIPYYGTRWGLYDLYY